MKKFILSLFVGLFGLIGFGSCFDLTSSKFSRTFNNFVYTDSSGMYFSITSLSNNYGPVIVKVDNLLSGQLYYCSDYTCSSTVDVSENLVFIQNFSDKIYLTGSLTSGIHMIIYNRFPGSCNSCPSCPSTGDILSGYILESDITQNYCEVEFGLITPENCPSYGSGVGTGDIMWSSFYVNDEQILGGANIYLTIPDYLKWDYIYVDQDLEIDVENEGDEEYIQGIIDINSYRPTSEDFTDIFVSGLTLIMPYIVIILFIVFVWKLIKRIFK